MADPTDLVNRLTNNPSFMTWLRGQANKRGVPSWKDTTAGRAGGYPGRLPGMPLAPGTSNMPGATRAGGTYAPSGNMPMPTGGSPPAATGGAGGPPAIGGGGGGPPGLGGNLNFNRLPGAAGVGALVAPAFGIATQPDVGWPKRTQGADPAAVLKKLTQPPVPAGAAASPASPPPGPPGPPPKPGETYSYPPSQFPGNINSPPVSPPTQQTPPWPINPNSSIPWPNQGQPPGGTPLPKPRPPMPMTAPGQGKGALPPFATPGAGGKVGLPPMAASGQGKPAAPPLPQPRPQVPMPQPRPQMPVNKAQQPPVNPITGGPLEPHLAALLQAIFGNPVTRDRQAPTP